MDKKEVISASWCQLAEALKNDNPEKAQSALNQGACAWIDSIEFVKLGLGPEFSNGFQKGDAISVSIERGASLVFEILVQSVLDGEALHPVPKATCKAWMKLACMGGRLAMAKRLLVFDAAGPDVRTVFDLLDALRRQKGKHAVEHAGRRWRPLDGSMESKTWGDLLGPVFDWAVEFVPAQSYEDGAPKGITLLMRAGDGIRARKLLAQGADPWARDARNMGALEHAMNSGERGWIQAVAGSGIDLAQGVAWGRKSGLNKATEWAIEALAASIAQACDAPLVQAASLGAKSRL